MSQVGRQASARPSRRTAASSPAARSTPSGCKAALPIVRDQTYAQLSLAEPMLADGRTFLLGGEPSLADCALYNPVWFIQQQLGASRARRSTGCRGSSPGRSA